MLKPACKLGILALICASLLVLTHRLTQTSILTNRANFEEAQLLAIVDDDRFNIKLISDQYYLFNKHEKIVGKIIKVETEQGYNGRIALLIVIDQTDTLLGVRVIKHQETPGLGDKIELAVSNWILAFNGKSLVDTQWDVKKYGGDFDQFTGATITPRAVIRAVEQALKQHMAADHHQP